MNEVPNYAPGMRNAASQLRGKAETMALLANRIDTTVGPMSYSGPSANRFKAEMTELTAIMRRVGGITQQLVDMINNDAAKLEAGQTDGPLSTGGVI